MLMARQYLGCASDVGLCGPVERLSLLKGGYRVLIQADRAPTERQVKSTLESIMFANPKPNLP